MTRNQTIAIVFAGLAAGVLFLGRSRPTPVKPTAPAAPVTPAPEPKRPRPCPGPGPCPRPAAGNPVGASAGAFVGGSVAPDGTEIQCDLPGALHLKNVGGSDGAGLCVFTSISHSARWQNVPVLADFRDWMRQHPGGGYPDKVRAMIERCATERGQPVPDYLQVEGEDLGVLRAACASGRMPGVTYGFSPTGRYAGQRISHMVSLVHADDRHFVILDNNYPGGPGKTDTYEWLTPEEFRRTYAPGWCVVLLSPPPPPPPTNGDSE